MKIEIEITDKDIADTLCSGFEGGIAYWVNVGGGVHIEPGQGEPAKPWGDDYTPSYISAPLTEGGSVTFGTCDGVAPKRKLDRAAIAGGIKLMAERYPRHFADMIGETGDATTGDVLIQLSIFDEIVFG